MRENCNGRMQLRAVLKAMPVRAAHLQKVCRIVFSQQVYEHVFWEEADSSCCDSSF